MVAFFVRLWGVRAVSAYAPASLVLGFVHLQVAVEEAPAPKPGHDQPRSAPPPCPTGRPTPSLRVCWIDGFGGTRLDVPRLLD